LEQVINAAGKKNEQLAIIGFNYDTMKLAKKRFPKLQVLWVVGHRESKEGQPAPTLEQLTEKAKAAGLDGLDLDYKFPLTGDAVSKIKAAGLKVFIWTVNDPAAAQKLVAAGVEGVTTDKPQLIREKLAKP
jgi:glycerophosphoryl diester phosphodiesterase